MKNFLLIAAMTTMIGSASAQVTTLDTGGLQFSLDNQNKTAMLVAHYYCTAWEDSGYYDDVVIPAYVAAGKGA